MRLRLFAAVIATLPLLAAGATAAAPFKATLRAPSHTPKANTKWRYSIRATDRLGTPIRATVTVQIIDPAGTAHPVLFDDTKRPIVRFAFKGLFRDFVVWPASSRGFRLVFRATVRANGGKVVLRYWVRPR